MGDAGGIFGNQQQTALSPPADNSNPYEKPRHSHYRRDRVQSGEGSSPMESPYAPKENMALANGFSHNQKLSKDNPYKERGSGLNHNMNAHVRLPSDSASPYLAEMNRIAVRARPGIG